MIYYFTNWCARMAYQFFYIIVSIIGILHHKGGYVYVCFMHVNLILSGICVYKRQKFVSQPIVYPIINVR